MTLVGKAPAAKRAYAPKQSAASPDAAAKKAAARSSNRTRTMLKEIRARGEELSSKIDDILLRLG